MIICHDGAKSVSLNIVGTTIPQTLGLYDGLCPENARDKCPSKLNREPKPSMGMTENLPWWWFFPTPIIQVSLMQLFATVHVNNPSPQPPQRRAAALIQ
mmetsp:Transcript_35664/g.72978  ORF Transcript_35664/g.72978 Transcript_35664/m.72978 type:complete len:99 (-) Transcript_35664:73-369(-)